MIRRQFAIACLPFLSLSLGGCGTVEPAADNFASAIGSPAAGLPTVVGLDVLSVVNTKKTIGDHVLGFVSGQDCSSVRASQHGPYCVEPDQPPPPPPMQRTYCYRSLGAVNCFEQPSTENLVGVASVPVLTP